MKLGVARKKRKISLSYANVYSRFVSVQTNKHEPFSIICFRQAHSRTSLKKGVTINLKRFHKAS